MRFGIVGTGAMGGLFAAYLSENDEKVVCYDNDQKVINAIEKNGLHLERPESSDIKTHPKVSTNPRDLGKVDALFILTKTVDTENALSEADAMIGKNTTIITVQNGLLNMETVSRFVPIDRILGGYTRMGANSVKPGHIVQLMNRDTVIGGDDIDTAETVAERLSAAGIETKNVSDPEPYIWDKQFMNVAIKPLAGLTELRNGPMINYKETRDAMRQLIEEAMLVAREKNVEILSDNPVKDVINRELDEEEKRKKSSILEDVENERPTEIKDINGAVVELGEKYNVDTPYNRLATQLMFGKERAYIENND